MLFTTLPPQACEPYRQRSAPSNRSPGGKFFGGKATAATPTPSCQRAGQSPLPGRPRTPHRLDQFVAQLTAWRRSQSGRIRANPASP